MRISSVSAGWWVSHSYRRDFLNLVMVFSNLVKVKYLLGAQLESSSCANYLLPAAWPELVGEMVGFVACQRILR